MTLPLRAFTMLAALFLLGLPAHAILTGAEKEPSSITIPAVEFHAHTAGAAQSNYWNLYENGELLCEFDVTSSGSCAIVIIARGEPAAGEWPMMSVSLNAETIYQAPVSSTNWSPYVIQQPLGEGRHEMAIGFLNDFFQEPEDRNLHLSSMTISYSSSNGTIERVSQAAYQKGHAARMEAWDKTVRERIERNRRGALVVWVYDEKDNPIPNATVRVEQVRHEFLFGCALSSAQFEPSSTNRESLLYREHFLRYFNHAVPENALKWDQMEPTSGLTNTAVADRMAEWCASNRVPLRGHCLFWGCHVPDWIKDLSDEELLQHMEQRTMRTVSRYAGIITDYDVLNEPLHCPSLEKRLGPAGLQKMFQWTRDADPMAGRYLNEYNVLAGGRAGEYAMYIQQKLSEGIPISGIGVQGHFTGTADPRHITRVLDRLAAFNLPIKITEFDCDNTNDTLQAECLTTLYRAAFAHPAVQGILMWGFWENAHWRPRAAMLRSDFSKTPMAKAYEKLVFKEWWTEDSGKTDEVGRYECPAFFGEHEVRVTLPDGRTESQILHLPSKERAAIAMFHLGPDTPKAAPEKRARKVIPDVSTPKAPAREISDDELNAPVGR